MRRSLEPRFRQRTLRRYNLRKEKNDNLDLIKMKTFIRRKDPVNKMKRQTKDLEEIFSNHISDKGIVSRIHKELAHTEKQWIQLENGQKTFHWRDNSWQISTWKHMCLLINGSIISHQRNANEDHSEMPLYTYQNGWNEKLWWHQTGVRLRRNGITHPAGANVKCDSPFAK